MVESHYHIALTDTERGVIERQAFNFHAAFGKSFMVPPRLFEDLKNAGVDMTHIAPNPALDDDNLRPHDGASSLPWDF